MTRLKAPPWRTNAIRHALQEALSHFDAGDMELALVLAMVAKSHLEQLANGPRTEWLLKRVRELEQKRGEGTGN